MQKHEPSQNTGRTIIHIAQGEIAILNCKKNSNTDLMTLGLMGCCAVLFIDDHSNIILAHVDDIIDLDFVKTFTAKMQGKYTIDIIAHSDHLDPMGNAISNYLKKHFPAIKNSKGTHDIRKTKTGVVLIQSIDNEIKLLTPQRPHMAMLSRLNAQNRLKMKIPEDNPFRNDSLEEGGRFDQVRMFERSCEAHCTDVKRMPTLVYDNNWTGNFPETSTKVQVLLEDLKKCSTPASREACLRKTVLDTHKGNIPFIIQALDMYKHCLAIEEKEKSQKSSIASGNNY